jgi:hypothetical protein
MPNTLLTPDMITREALRVLHQKLTFVGSINRAYDNSFAQSGAKIGDTLRIRLPNQYTVRTGAALAAQDTVEQNTTLQVATQRGVDLSFTSVDLTMDLDDFSKRIIQPAMAVLSASIEADALQNMTRDVYQVVNGIGSAITFKNVMNGRKRLNDSLAPNGDRTALLNTQDNVELVDALKGLFQDSNAIKQQYREGVMGMTGGFEFAETTHMTTQSRGTANTGYLTNGANQVGSSIIVDTGTGTIGVGEIITFAGVFEVHPETKVVTNRLQQFVVTSAYAGGGGTIQVSPAIVATGARQNVSNAVADNSAVTVIGTSGTAYGQSLVYHKDAFTFATADLVLPQGVDMASRQVYDGISMRMVRQYDINNDAFPVRLDVLYGYKTLRAQLAARLLSNA